MLSMSSFHPPIRISANRRYFVDAGDKPFFWLGDTAWPLFTGYSRTDAERYLENRAAKGFTVIQGVLAWGDPNVAVDLAGTPPMPNPEGELPWGNSPDEPNEKYFRHVDYLLNYANRLGLVLAVLPVWGYDVNDARLVDEHSAYIYGKWLGARYRNQPNLIWINGGDREPLGYEAVYRALAHGLREGDGGAHLITYHPCGWHSSSYYFHEEDWLDFNLIQTWTWWHCIYPAVSADYALLPTKPVVLGEGAYEDGPEYPLGPITPLVVRRQAWWTLMAGGFFTYGQNQMWRREPGWQETFDTPGANQMSIFRQIAGSFPWWQMIPDQGLFDWGVGSGQTLNTAMRTTDRTCAIIYLSSQCHVRLNLDRIATRRVKVTWANPQDSSQKEGGIYATGRHLEGSTFPRRTSEWFSTPDFWEDAVLILDGID